MAKYILKVHLKIIYPQPKQTSPKTPTPPRQLFQHPTLSSSPLPVPHPVVPSLNVARRWVVPPSGWCPPHRGKLQPNSTLKFPGTLNEEGSLQPNTAIGCFFLRPLIRLQKYIWSQKLCWYQTQWPKVFTMTKYMDLQSISPTPKASKWPNNAGDSDRGSTSSINHTVKNLHFFLGGFFPLSTKKNGKKGDFAWPFSSIFPMLGDFPSLLVFSLRKSPNQPKTRSANANTSSSKAKSLYHIATIPYTTVIVEFKWTLRAFNFQWFNQWLVNLPRATYPSQINRALRENQRLKSPQIRPYFRGGVGWPATMVGPTHLKK